ncbi:MAG: patatin-like phospholipase family protein [Flavobacteriaceae bacterium]
MNKLKTGIVLSGGGIKGLVHIGMFKYLEEINFRPDVIAACSTGSIVAAFYACGYSNEDIYKFYTRAKPFARKYWTGSRGIMKTERYQDLFKKYLGDRKIEDLDVELKIVATNLFNGTEKVFTEGSLVQAVLASCSFPGVFQPMKIDGILYSDGGILNNFPVDVIKNDCDYIIGMHLSPNKIINEENLRNTRDILMRVVAIQGTFWDHEKLKDCNIGLMPIKLADYSSFSMNEKTYKPLFKLGYDAIEEYSHALKNLTP